MFAKDVLNLHSGKPILNCYHSNRIASCFVHQNGRCNNNLVPGNHKEVAQLCRDVIVCFDSIYTEVLGCPNASLFKYFIRWLYFHYQ